MLIHVTTGGRITIPKRTRESLGIRRGTRVKFSIVGKHCAVMSRADGKPWRTPLARRRGTRKGAMTTEEIMRLLRRGA